MSHALTSDTANNPELAPPTKALPQNRRLVQLMLATSLGISLSLPAIFLVPIWPRLAPIVIVLLLLTVTGLWLLQYRVSKTLAIPKQEAQQKYRWPWQYASAVRTYRRNYIRALMWLAAYLFSFGAFNLVLQWLTRTRDWDFAGGFALPNLIAGIFSYIVFALLWGREGKPIDRALNRPIGTGFLITTVVIVGALGYLQAPNLLSHLKEGPAVPWAEQWAAAQNAISGKYTDAVLTSLRASRDYDAPNSYNASLHLTFQFVNQLDGAEPQVTLRDSNPEASVQIFGPYEPFDKLSVYTSDNLAKLKTLLATIRISPRDALQKTIAAIQKDTPGLTTQPDRYPSITLFLDGLERSDNGTFISLNRPSVWEVDITLPSGNNSVQCWIDAQTGDILLKQNDK